MKVVIAESNEPNIETAQPNNGDSLNSLSIFPDNVSKEREKDEQISASEISLKFLLINHRLLHRRLISIDMIPVLSVAIIAENILSGMMQLKLNALLAMVYFHYQHKKK
jgi:hypothetical protein